MKLMNVSFSHIVIKAFLFLLSLWVILACGSSHSEIQQDQDPDNQPSNNELPYRQGSRPETTDQVPHVQIGVDLVPEVHAEMVRMIYEIPGVEDRPSVIALWRGMWLSETITIEVPEAIISGREFGHIHDDGSLHIFLEPSRAEEAVEKGWAVFHPFAIAGEEGWDGFVMLYTPQSFEELDVTFFLIQEAYDYITGTGPKGFG